MQAERGERNKKWQKVFFCSHTNFLWRLSARYTQIESRTGSAREFFGGEKKSVGERKNFWKNERTFCGAASQHLSICSLIPPFFYFFIAFLIRGKWFSSWLSSLTKPKQILGQVLGFRTSRGLSQYLFGWRSCDWRPYLQALLKSSFGPAELAKLSLNRA
jgi:hypothetical protein